MYGKIQKMMLNQICINLINNYHRIYIMYFQKSYLGNDDRFKYEKYF